MKMLMLVRHASSGTDDMSLSDRTRPLDARGERALAWLAAHCGEHLARPDLIVTSPAQRALATAHALADAMGCTAQQLRSDERLYGGWGRGLCGVLASLDDTLDRVAIVGHNPEVSAIARHLAAPIAHVPSGALLALAFDVPRWSEITPQQLVSARLHAPARPASVAGAPHGAGAPARVTVPIHSGLEPTL